MASILCIAPSETIKASVLDALEEHQQYYRSVFGIQEYARPDIIVELDGDLVDLRPYNPDIVIARGLTAKQFKKQHPETPVVEIPVTALDIISAIRQFRDEDMVDRRVALVSFGKIRDQTEAVGRLLNLKIEAFAHYRENLDEQFLSLLFDTVIEKGIRHVIGGVRTVEAARRRNLSAAFLPSSQESIWLALTEAQHIAVIHRTERERAARFATILDHSVEGIITTNESNRVIQMNAAAMATLNMGASKCIGEPIYDIIKERRFIDLIEDGADHADELVKIGRKKIIVTLSAASLGGKAVGNVITFQDITNVRETEIKIRNKLHERGLVAKYSFGDIIGESPAIKKAVENAKTFARTHANILILGETGTGKELFAQSVHKHSERRSGPFVAVNCAAIPESLMESEFFGYAGGAFTDAAKDGKMGYFELAHDGTLFMDEVSEIPLNLQGKLLRVIQENEVMPIGYDKVIPVDVRIVCASNKDLKSLVKQGKFREDLYYRLAVMQLRIPPLRDRGEDILLIVENFLNQSVAAKSAKKIVLADNARPLFLRHRWDGNIRELRNVCEQLVALNRTGEITRDEAADILSDAAVTTKEEPSPRGDDEKKTFTDNLRQIEKKHIVRALKESGFKRTEAARSLGMDRSTLWRKMKEYGIAPSVEG